MRFSLVFILALLIGCGKTSDNPVQTKSAAEGEKKPGNDPSDSTKPRPEDNFGLESEGQLLCVAGTTHNTISLLRDRASADVFPVAFYIKIKQNGFQVHNIGNIALTGRDPTNLDVIYTGYNNGLSEDGARLLFQSKLDLTTSDFSLQPMGFLTSSLAELEINKQLSEIKGRFWIAAALDKGRLLAPTTTDKGQFWAIWQNGSDKPTKVLNKLPFPEFFNPQVMGNFVAFQSFDLKTKKFSKRIGVVANADYVELYNGTGEKEISQMAGSVLPGENAFFWWIEASKAGNRLATWKTASKKLERYNIVMGANEKLIEGLGHVQANQGALTAELLIEKSGQFRSQKFALQGNGLVAGSSVAVPTSGIRGEKPVFQSVELAENFIFAHFQTLDGQGVVNRFDRRTQSWELLRRMDCFEFNYLSGSVL